MMLSSTARGLASSSHSSPPDSPISQLSRPDPRCVQPNLNQSPTIQSQSPTAFAPTRLTPPQQLDDPTIVTREPSTPALAPLHRRQQSSTSLLPLALINRATSPERRQQRPTLAIEMPYTGDGKRTKRVSDVSSRSEQSEGAAGDILLSPLSIRGAESAVPGDERTPISTEVTPTRNNRTSTPGERQISPASSRFAFLASGMSAISSRLAQSSLSPSAKSNEPQDDLSSLNVEAALFPAGAPAVGDTFSPAAYKNLQVNAVALARRLQNGYTEQARALRELSAEREADLEEMEEATTRATHLKMQLEDMAYKAADQERAMRELLDELAAERRKTARLLAAAGGVSSPKGPHVRLDQQTHGTGPASEGSIVEDLEVDAAVEELQYRRRMNNWRSSGGADSFDTDDDSMAEVESVFSRSRSSTTTDGLSSALPRSPSSVTMAPPSVLTKTAPKSSASKGVLPQRSAPVQQKHQSMTAFQKLVRNVTSASPIDNGVGSANCANCRGQDAGMAWDTVGLLKDENKALKQRVGELEGAVESALDLVNGVGL
ncbi:hypothetical protein MCOR25_010926 [Pyricularia grisea]|nr:hypothetical protein MCOR25_010926 [Pyricularia grisea]